MISPHINLLNKLAAILNIYYYYYIIQDIKLLKLLLLLLIIDELVALLNKLAIILLNLYKLLTY